MSKNKTSLSDFETNLLELTSLVETMEKGGLDLETSLSQYERGIQLVNTCQKKLNDAAQKVEQLTQQINETEKTTSPLLETNNKDEPFE